MLVRGQSGARQNSQVIFCKTAFQPASAQSVCVQVAIAPYGQQFALPCVKLHKVPVHGSAISESVSLVVYRLHIC